MAWMRMLTAVGAAATGSFLGGLEPAASALFLIYGLVWVPWSCVVLFAADRSSRVATIGGPAGDLVVGFATASLLPVTQAGVMLGSIVIVAFGAGTAGREAAGMLASVAIGLALAARAVIEPAERVAPETLASFGVGLILIVVLLDRSRTLQQRATETSVLLAGKTAAVLDRVADGVVVTDGAGVIREWNSACERIADVTRLAHGASCSDVFGFRDGERRLDCSSGCPLLGADPNEHRLGHELWRSDGSGRRQPVLANVSAVRNGDGSLREVVHSFRDITRVKQAEEAKTLFLATASHELKTPLTVISGFAEALREYPDLSESQRAEAVEAIARRAVELNRIVERLLLSSRIETGRVQLSVGDVDLEAVVTERACSTASGMRRQIVVDIEPGLPSARADVDAFITIFDHLIDNAIKYSPDGGPVEVSVTSTPEAIRVAVSDRGIGMDAYTAARCFDRFWQAESTDVRRFGGTGIGLYIVRSLAEAMNATVDVASQREVGTTVTLHLARADAEREPEAAVSGERTSIREFMRQLGVPERTS